MLPYILDPLTDSRWDRLLTWHPLASVFHTSGWLGALQRTYRYEPLVVTTCPPTEELTNGVAFCRVKSFVTGSRLVSLPFSDHCDPLATSDAELDTLLSSIACLPAKLRCRYVELRPSRTAPRAGTGFASSRQFVQHRLPLSRNPEELFSRFSKGCVQRKIRRAERKRLVYLEGRSEDLIQAFYRLLLMTRRRHRLPPQPQRWFRELVGCLGDGAKVRVASVGDKAVASIVTLRFKDAMVYKYGCSDARYNNLGGFQMLLWRAIEEAAELGIKEFDFGRSDMDNESLATFKDRWGAVRSGLTYWTSTPVHHKSSTGWASALARRTFAHAPDWLMALSGRLLYRHVG